MYKNTKWFDRVVDSETGEIIQEGTDQSAAHFNNMEEGIADAHIAAALMQIAFGIARENMKPYIIDKEVINFQNPAEGDALIDALLDGRVIYVSSASDTTNEQNDARTYRNVLKIIVPEYANGSVSVYYTDRNGDEDVLTLKCSKSV